MYPSVLELIGTMEHLAISKEFGSLGARVADLEKLRQGERFGVETFRGLSEQPQS